jgi:hypothetical protein
MRVFRAIRGPFPVWEAPVRIATVRPERWQPDRELLATLGIVSEVVIVADPAAVSEIVQAERSPHAKCERCWNYRPGVGQDAGHPTLCDRCVRVITEMDGQGGVGWAGRQRGPRGMRDRIRHSAPPCKPAGPGVGRTGGRLPPDSVRSGLNSVLSRGWPSSNKTFHGSVGDLDVFWGYPWASTVARFGRIDRSSREVTSRLNASVYACHHQLVNGYRSRCFGVVGPERPSGQPAIDLSGRKTSNRGSIVLPRWFVDDGPTVSIA